MPSDHQKYIQWNGERFTNWAGKMGSHTRIVVRAILSSYKVEQQGYKSCMGLLRPSLKNIQAILASGQEKAVSEQRTVTASSSQYGFTRGAEYYGRGHK